MLNVSCARNHSGATCAVLRILSFEKPAFIDPVNQSHSLLLTDILNFACIFRPLSTKSVTLQALALLAAQLSHGFLVNAHNAYNKGGSEDVLLKIPQQKLALKLFSSM